MSMTARLLTPDQAAELLLVMVNLAVLGGVAGGVVLLIVVAAVSSFGEWFEHRERRRLRIAAARLRNVHGPALFPGFSRSSRAAMIRVLRNRAGGVYG